MFNNRIVTNSNSDNKAVLTHYHMSSESIFYCKYANYLMLILITLR